MLPRELIQLGGEGFVQQGLKEVVSLAEGFALDGAEMLVSLHQGDKFLLKRRGWTEHFDRF